VFSDSLFAPQMTLVGSVVCFLSWKKKTIAWLLERTIPTERPPLVGGVSAKFCE
jgi:hypothetical protein